MRFVHHSRSIRTHLVMALLGLTFLASVSLLLASGVSARRHLREQLRQRLITAAASGALLVDGDAVAHLQSRDDERRAVYRRVRATLRRLRDVVPGVGYVHLLRPTPDPTRWTFVADAEERGDLASHVGDTYRAARDSEIAQALSQPTADRAPLRNHRRSWLAGYAPVLDRAGRPVAVIGVYMSTAQVRRQENAFLRTLTMVAGFCLLLAIVIAEALAGVLSRPIIALARGTHLVAQGKLDTEVAVGGSRELVELGESFNRMTKALRVHHRRLVELGTTDFLTGVRNHGYFQERLNHELQRAQRYHRPLSLAMLDLDHFREANAMHGHQGGDDLLRQVAQVIRREVRNCDVVTRYGGEEFAVIMPETATAEAVEAAERVRSAIARDAFEIRSLGTRARVRLTISGGVAEFPVDSGDKDGLIVAADLALLRAKYLSRNRICRYSEGGHWHPYRLDPAQLHQALQNASIAAVESLAQALDARDHYTRGHSDNVTRVALAIARAMEMPTSEQMKLRIAGLLHDVGKIGIPDTILKKREDLTPAEQELIKAHPGVGATILAKAPLLADVVPIVLGHHEHYDGQGYPHGAAGEKIPPLARVLAVADAYDAMTSDRPYRAAMSKEQALQELQDQAGRQFDPAVVAAFTTIIQTLDGMDLSGVGAETAA